MYEIFKNLKGEDKKNIEVVRYFKIFIENILII